MILVKMFLFMVFVALIGELVTWYTERKDGNWGEF